MRIFLATIIMCLLAFSECNPIPDQDALEYLQKYGYIEAGIGNTASIVSRASMSGAVKDFQRFAGLNQTGELDRETLTMMGKPRCGVKDIGGQSRKKRYAHQGSSWSFYSLTYRISQYPSTLTNRREVDQQIAKAFRAWSDVTSLKFRQGKRENVDIDISFFRGEHGDGDSFDGPGKTLAHAFFPEFGGDVHFDDSERWTIQGKRGVNLFQIAAHELGHSLGLDHSNHKGALMAPFYHGYDASFHLHEDDITAIRVLYKNPIEDEGTREVLPDDDESLEAPPTDVVNPPDICQDSKIDAATTTQSGDLYLFKGEFYWKLLEDGIADGYPRWITEDWNGLEGNLDASLTRSNGKTFFFKDGRYWRFTNRKMDPGYPKPISAGFKGIPANLDAAFVWRRDGKTYFFKGAQYWRHDNPPLSDKYPRPISDWTNLPNNIDAALPWNNNRTFFFKGNNYYRFNDERYSVDNVNPPYPRSTATGWFHCGITRH